MRAVGTSELCQPSFPIATIFNSVNTLAFCDIASTFLSVDMRTKSLLGIDGTKLTLCAAGMNNIEDMTSEKVSVKRTANNHDDSVKFHVH